MGGDGGTISSSRAYLRGAGKADHTADHKRHATSRTKEDEAECARTTLTTCAVSGESLDLSPRNDRGDGTVSVADIVACPYGRLYKREKVLEALLMRSCGEGTSECLNKLVHIRGRKDLYPVRFHVVEDLNKGKQQQLGEKRQFMATCPITGSEIGSGSIPAFLVVRSSSNNSNSGNVADSMPNVISERAIQEMGINKLQDEYGPFEKKDLIRLAPSNRLFEDIRKRWKEQMEMERVEKLSKKKDKKRKRTEDPPKKMLSASNGNEQNAVNALNESTHRGSNNTGFAHNAQHKRGHNQQAAKVVASTQSAAAEARSTVRSAVESNPVLSTLFGGKKGSASEKERRDALFTRNC
ncbi:hypothetical protein HJC23_001587 [Cyclotella cryptica]|uniref:Replication termination factor 2 n=1 Tax=Cyclotella cryptica TaxID=29204 RepID=A0ABD3NT42_9STRA|eukprot:CCRYP_020079-RA/>CCRYP_020079-RA protein AED:0.02 eAED:0.02 QI:200/1/1/1/1/1/2/54/352